MLEKALRRREVGRPISPVNLIIRPHEHVQHDIVQAQLMLIRQGERRPPVNRPADERHLLGIIKRFRMPHPLLQIILRLGDKPLISSRRPGHVSELLTIFPEVIPRRRSAPDFLNLPLKNLDRGCKSPCAASTRARNV